MVKFANQSIGSLDTGSNTHEYVAVEYDETKVAGFSFHSVMTRDVSGFHHRLHGVSVDPRHIWAAISGFNSSPDKVIWKDGGTSWVTLVYINEPGKPEVRELRTGGKYGDCVARMTKTGYIQRGEAG